MNDCIAFSASDHRFRRIRRMPAVVWSLKKTIESNRIECRSFSSSKPYTVLCENYADIVHNIVRYVNGSIAKLRHPHKCYIVRTQVFSSTKK